MPNTIINRFIAHCTAVLRTLRVYINWASAWRWMQVDPSFSVVSCTNPTDWGSGAANDGNMWYHRMRTECLDRHTKWHRATWPSRMSVSVRVWPVRSLWGVERPLAFDRSVARGSEQAPATKKPTRPVRKSKKVGRSSDPRVCVRETPCGRRMCSVCALESTWMTSTKSRRSTP